MKKIVILLLATYLLGSGAQADEPRLEPHFTTECSSWFDRVILRKEGYILAAPHVELHSPTQEMDFRIRAQFYHCEQLDNETRWVGVDFERNDGLLVGTHSGETESFIFPFNSVGSSETTFRLRLEDILSEQQLNDWRSGKTINARITLRYGHDDFGYGSSNVGHYYRASGYYDLFFEILPSGEIRLISFGLA